MPAYDGGRQGGGGDDSTTDTTSDSSSSYEGDNQTSDGDGFELPEPLKNLKSIAPILTEFGNNPVGFVLGAILSTFLGGVQTLIEALIDGLLVLAVGSDGVPSATGTLGVADIPVFLASKLGGGVASVFTGIGANGSGVFNAIRTFNRTAVEIATAAGPLSAILYSAIVAATIIVVAWLLRTAIGVVADAVPGLEGILG